MADNNIKIGVQVTDNGTSGQTSKNVKNVKDILDQTTASATKATAAISAMHKSSSAGGATTAKIKEASGDERGMYAAARASVGTGAAARDFAKESQGLGGIVRLYATLAANIFAVGAAFNALSTAMDTTNMVKGLDQLGSASGRNLGAVAKQLVAATDGAINLRDALTATAQASSSGMSNTSILKLGEVARKASQALGVAMPDAISRLSRGIAKIEPELLDELGIFVKIDKATEDYARSVGKSASVLTDFEKRQAFANAVLAEGSAKFSAINIDTNPYEKIAATFQNLVQSGLELVNKVITPITKLFASSPTALGITIALFAKTLIGQAIPVLGEWKKGLENAAEAARQNAIKTNKARQSLSASYSEKAVLDAVEAEKAALDKVDQGVAKLRKFKRYEKTAELIPTTGIDEASAKALEARSKAINDSYSKGQVLSEKTVASKKREEDAINSVTRAYREQIKQQQLVEKFLAENQSKIGNYLSVNAAANRLADAAAAKSQRTAILSSVVEGVGSRGVSGSFQELNRQIGLAREGKDALGKPFEDGQKKMSAFNAGLTRTIATATILGSALGTVASSLGTVAFVVGALIALYEVLDTFINTSAKQSKAFSDATDTLASSIENVNKTLENINTKKSEEFFSVESTQAKTNALTDLSDSVNLAVIGFQKLIAAQSGWDRGWDRLFDFFGKGSGDKLAAGLSQSIISGISTIESPAAKQVFQDKIKEILNVSDADLNNVKALDTALDKLSSEDKIRAGMAIGDAFKEVKENTTKSTANLVGFKDALTESTKLVDSMNASIKPTDNLGKTGDVLINASYKLGIALQDPVNAFTAIKELVNNTKVLSLLPPEEGMRLVGLRNEFNKLAADSANTEKTLQKAIKERIKLEEQYNAEKGRLAPQSQAALDKAERDAKRAAGRGGTVDDAKLAVVQAQILAGDEKRLLPSKQAFETAKAFELASQAGKEAFEKEKARLVEIEQKNNINIYKAGAKALEQSLKGAFAEAGIIVARGYLSIISGAGGQTGVEEATLKQQEIKIQIDNINAIYENSRQLRRLNLVIEKDTNAREIAQLSAMAAVPGEELKGEDKRKLESLTQRQRVIELVQSKITPSRAQQAPKEAGAGRGAGYIQSSGPTDAQLAEQELGTLKAEQVKVAGETAKLFAQIQVLDVDKKIVIPLRNAAKLEKERLEYSANAVARKIEEEDQLISIVGIYNKDLQSRKDGLAISALNNKYDQDKLNLLTDQEVLQRAINSGKLDSETRAKAEQTIFQNNIRLSELQVGFEDKLAKLKDTQYIQELQKTEELRVKELTRDTTALENTRQIQIAKLSIREAELSYLTATGRISEKAIANEQFEIALIKQRSEYEKESNDLNNERLKIQQDLIIAKQKLEATTPATIQQLDVPSGTTYQAPNPAFIAAQTTLTTEAEKQNAVLDSTKQKLDAVNESRIRGLEISRAAQLETAATNKRLEEQALAMEKLQGVAQGLGAIFGEFGKSLGTGLESMLKANQDFTNKRIEVDKKYAKDRRDLEKSQAEELANISDAEGLDPEGAGKALIKAKKDQTKATVKLETDAAKKSKQLELDKNISMAASAKGMFKEKTLAHKAFATFEKLMMVAKLAMLAQEAIATLTNSATVIAAEGGKAAASGLGAIMKAYNLPPPVGFIAGAAMAAIVASFLGGSLGNSGGGAPAGFSAEEQQKVQGTGQAYKDGKLVETGGGTFGDVTAKSQSIGNSIDIIKNTSVEGLSLSNKMLTALENIDRNTQSAARGLYSIPGIRTGSLFGTEEGTSTSGIKGLFGKQTSREIADVGLVFKGVFLDLIDATKNSIQLYENVVTTTTRSGFLGIGGGTSTSTSTNIKDLDNTVKEQIAAIFSNATTLFITYGKKLGQTESQVLNTLAEVPVDKLASLRGLTGEDFAKEFSSVVGSILDDASAALFTQLSQYKKFGEGFLETAVRVFDANDKVNLAFKGLGLVSDLSIDITEALVDVSGGLKDFLSNIKGFQDKFLTAGEKLVPQQQALAEELNNLGFSSVTTRQDFKNLILSFDLSNKATFPLYNSLLQLAPAFDVVVSAAEKYTTTLEDQKTKMGQLGIAGGNTPEQAKQLARTREENKLREDYTGIQAQTLIANQRLIYAEEDRVAGVKRYISVLQAEGRVAQALVLTRQLETIGMDAAEKTTRETTNAIADGAKTRDLEIELMSAQGYLQIVLNHTRSKELDALSEGDKIIKRQTYAIQDQNKSRDLEIEKMNAQGLSHAVLIATREKELLGLSDEDKIRKRQTYAIQDNNKTRDLETARMQAQGFTHAALVIAREKELVGLSEYDAAIKRQTFAIEDQNKSRDLEIELMNAQGFSYVALIASRQKELIGLSEADKLRKQAVFDQEDQNKTRALEIELMTAQGNNSGALLASRTLELKGMSASDQELKRRIWLLNDEAAALKARSAIEVEIYNLLGNSAEALRITREEELSTIEEALRPAKRYVYALQDQRAILDKLRTSLNNTTSSLRSAIESLKDYQKTLLLGDKSILTPSEKYTITKQEFFRLKTLAEAVAITDSEKAAQAAAIGKLPGASDAFLEASRTLFASSQQYTDDFRSVNTALDSLIGKLGDQLTDAERQLAAAEASAGFLDDIEKNTKTTAELMADFITATNNVATARTAAAASGSVAAGGTALAGTNTSVPGTQVSTGTITPVASVFTPLTPGPGVSNEAIVRSWYANHRYAPVPDSGAISFWTDYLSTHSFGGSKRSFTEMVSRDQGLTDIIPIGEFARGGLARGLSLVGEQGPELVDFATPGRVYPAGQTSAMLANNTALVNEIKALRDEVEKLRADQREQTGHLITTNYDANRAAAEVIAAASDEAAKTMDWNRRSAVVIV